MNVFNNLMNYIQNPQLSKAKGHQEVIAVYEPETWKRFSKA